ncbi:MAG: pyridoxal-phosphate dependent enzyme [Nitrososphaerota archaeon]|nr:pyridoxal-phosphate dependent enzyme [Nitrososphaerota archaeon]
MRMEKYVCRKCGYTESAGRWLWKCPKCGGVLDVIPAGTKCKKCVTLGEGDTPLVNLFGFGRNIFFKLEYTNPTGSFKDRGTSAAISRALEMGTICVTEDSSGNAGISVSAYAASAGIRANIVVPRDIAVPKRMLMESLGAQVYEAEDRDDASAKAQEMEGKGCAYIGHPWNPWFVHGMVKFSGEIVKQMKGVPDAIVMPVSSGTLFVGSYQGFADMKGKVPRMYAVQATGTAPLYEKVHGKTDGNASRLADALKIREPPRLEQMAEIVSKTGGDVSLVNDQMIVESLRKLLQSGAIVEPTSAAALAGYYDLLDSGKIDRDEKTVIVLTGSGLKYYETLFGARG